MGSRTGGRANVVFSNPAAQKTSAARDTSDVCHRMTMEET
jgi:hypothetical protein